jgi:nucleoside-diphosphate-sugar epimerase
MSSLFITGFSGFIGSNLLRRIDPRKYQKVYGLGRTQPAGHFPENFQFVKGCICDTDSYARYLNSCDTVIHLAAATGKAMPAEYFKVNTRGTELLIEQSQQSGVKNFLYVSTIAAKFADKNLYYYAQSKEQGEHAVTGSRLNYAIVRPTIVIGKEAVIWKTLSNLARKPVLLMLGDGTARIQPIYIEDLVDCLLTILDSNYFSNEVYELGGPEEITFEHLLKRIHHLYHAKDPSVVHIPLKLLSATLSFLEKRFYSVLPINAGQLCAFNNDGTIEMNRLFRVAAPQMRNVDSMLQQVVPASNRAVLVSALDQECIAFSHYLVRRNPSRYVVDKYCEANATGSFIESCETNHFDRLLLSLAVAHPGLAKLVDSYTGIFLKSATVRNKWILLLAIMESSAPSYEYFDSPDSSSRSLLFAQMIWQGMVFLTCLCLSTIVLTPLRVILALYSTLMGRN